METVSPLAQAGNNAVAQLRHCELSTSSLGMSLLFVAERQKRDMDRLSGAHHGTRLQPVNIFEDIVIAVESAAAFARLPEVLLDDIEIGLNRADALDDLPCKCCGRIR